MSRSTTEAINSYLTDMLALEQHIEVAISAQVKDLKDEPPVLVMALEAIHVTVEHHIVSLKEMIAERNAGAANSLAEAVKRAASVLAGAGAAAVDLVRNEKLPKDLRDDYTAFSLATVSYVMLLSTAMSLNDQQVAELAERHLKQYTKVVMKLNNILPSAVIAELREEGLPAREEQLPAIARTLKGVWSDPYNEVPEVDEISVA
jgi:ferritin-like metal-binding protein YciE